ncbi:MAG TPA: alpha-L-fucosidase, partial [Terriglobia bacterium]|nr:alpha-L-fucosidase [Terriglobia bacterium]
MKANSISRRDYLKLLGAGSAIAAIGANTACTPGQKEAPKQAETTEGPGEPASAVADRERRMKWWHAAKFGLFINYGLYSIIGQHEWAMEAEGIPISQYELLARHFLPKPGVAREWIKCGKTAGMKYAVMDTKHHEGFCMFDSKLTDYCAPRQACGRDLVREYVEAARAEGLRVGFY